MLILSVVAFALVILFLFFGKLEVLIFVGIAIPVLLVYWLFKKRFVDDGTELFEVVYNPQYSSLPGNIYHKG